MNPLYPLFPSNQKKVLDKIVNLEVSELEEAVASIINGNELKGNISREEITTAFYAQRERRRTKFENLIQLTRDISNILIGPNQKHPTYVVQGTCMKHPKITRPPIRETKLSEVREYLYDLPERVVAHMLSPYCTECASTTYPEKSVIQILPKNHSDVVFINGRLKAPVSLSKKMAFAIIGGIDPKRKGPKYGIIDEGGIVGVFNNQKRRDLAKKKLLDIYDSQLFIPGSESKFKIYKPGDKPWVGWKTFVKTGDTIELQAMAYNDLKRIPGQYIYGPVFDGELTRDELIYGMKERDEKESRIMKSLSLKDQDKVKRMASAFHFGMIYVTLEEAKKNNPLIVDKNEYLTRELLAAQKWAS